MNIGLDNHTQIIVQMAVSLMLTVVMLVAYRTEKTYPGFGRWTVSKIPHAFGWFFIIMRGVFPDWLSILVANFLLFLSTLLLYEGILQFRDKPHRDKFHYALAVLLIGANAYFTWVEPNVNARILVITVCLVIVIGRSAFQLLYKVPGELQSNYWFTAAIFGFFEIVLLLRIFTAYTLPKLSNPFVVDIWQSILYMGTIVMPIGWTFGFFMMTNARLNRELKGKEMELRQMATTDALTGALNRRVFLERIEIECSRANRSKTPMVLLVIDIDYFKKFNDTYGHQGGDDLLRALVKTCHANLRATDLLVRWGGEEFVVLLPNTDGNNGQLAAEKLRFAVEELSVEIDSRFAQTTISIGGAVWYPSASEWRETLKFADDALYRAKNSGRNCIIIDDRRVAMGNAG